MTIENDGVPVKPSWEPPDFKLKNRELTAFVVDENEFMCSIQKGFLGLFGVRSYIMRCAWTAMQLIRDGRNADLILIEKFLEDMDGIEATRQLRAMGVKCKILAVCCHPFKDFGERFLAAGADLYMEKPMDLDKLVEVLKELDEQQ